MPMPAGHRDATGAASLRDIVVGDGPKSNLRNRRKAPRSTMGVAERMAGMVYRGALSTAMACMRTALSCRWRCGRVLDRCE